MRHFPEVDSAQFMRRPLAVVGFSQPRKTPPGNPRY